MKVLANQEFVQSVLQIVNHIPYGKVASYGQIAKLAGYSGYARQVGHILKNLPEGSTIAWHRVVNSQGKLALVGEAAERQYSLLVSEGVIFKENGRVDLKQSAWLK